MKLKIDDRLADEIVVAALKSSMKIIKKNIKKNIKALSAIPEVSRATWQNEDLENDIQTLNAMRVVRDYYRGSW